MKDIQHSFSQGCTVVWHAPADSTTQTYNSATELVHTILQRAHVEELLDALATRSFALIPNENLVKRLGDFAETVLAEHVAAKLMPPTPYVSR